MKQKLALTSEIRLEFRLLRFTLLLYFWGLTHIDYIHAQPGPSQPATRAQNHARTSGTKRPATAATKSNSAVISKPFIGPIAVIETDKGMIEIELYKKESSKAVENFQLLAKRGYYNGLTFHRIVKGFMIQGGDPNGNGSGGESAWGGTFEDGINPVMEIYQRGYRRGIVAMANAGPDTNGSQFFIMHQDYPLPPQYVIFGNVIRGLEVVDALAEVPTALGADGNMSKPLSPVVIRKITIKPSRAVSARNRNPKRIFPKPSPAPRVQPAQ